MLVLPLLVVLLGCTPGAIARIPCRQCYRPNGGSHCVTVGDAREVCWGCMASRAPFCSGDLCIGHYCSVSLNISKGPFYLKNKLSGKCMDVKGDPGDYINAPIQLATCENGAIHARTDQKWYLAKGGFLFNAHSMLCVHVGNRTGPAGQHLVLGTCGHQQGKKEWRWHQSGFIQAQGLTTCIDVWGDPGRSDGDFIHLSKCEWGYSGTDQQWEYMEPLPFYLPLGPHAAALVAGPVLGAIVGLLFCYAYTALCAGRDKDHLQARGAVVVTPKS